MHDLLTTSDVIDAISASLLSTCCPGTRCTVPPKSHLKGLLLNSSECHQAQSLLENDGRSQKGPKGNQPRHCVQLLKDSMEGQSGVTARHPTKHRTHLCLGVDSVCSHHMQRDRCHNRKCVITHLILFLCPGGQSPSVHFVTLKGLPLVNTRKEGSILLNVFSKGGWGARTKGRDHTHQWEVHI